MRLNMMSKAEITEKNMNIAYEINLTVHNVINTI